MKETSVRPKTICCRQESCNVSLSDEPARKRRLESTRDEISEIGIVE